VEVTLLDLGEAAEQELEDRLELIDPKTGQPADTERADAAAMGLRLCYRLRHDPTSETSEHWVEYAATGTRAPRAERELVGAIALDRAAPLQLRAEGLFRRLVAGLDEDDLVAALASFRSDLATATDKLAETAAFQETIKEVLDAGPSRLLGMAGATPADDVGFVAEDGTISGVLRSIQPTLTLDDAGSLPLPAHGSTATGVLAAAEAIVFADRPGAIVLGDDFGDDLDAASAEFLAARLRRGSGQVWLSTRRPEVARAFRAEELIRLTRSHGQRQHHQLAATTDRKARAARRHLHTLLLPAMTARTVAILEGPHDLDGYSAVADRQLHRSGIAPPAAYGARLVPAGLGDGGKEQIPKLARLARELGFHVRVVLDNDKPGSDTDLVTELTSLVEQVVRLPERTSVERALVAGVDEARLRAALGRVVSEYGLPIDVSKITTAELEANTVGVLKQKGGLHRPFVEALPRGDMPPLATKVLKALKGLPASDVLVKIPAP
jgi:hypothetical protein